MGNQTRNLAPSTSLISIIVVALVQCVGSVAFLCLGALMLRGTIAQAHSNVAVGFVAISPSSASIGLSLGVVPISFGLDMVSRA